MIGGKERKTKDFGLKVGLGVFNVIAVNPTKEEFKEVLGIELPEDSKVTDYLGESRDGNTQLRIDFWGEEVKTKMKQKVSFFIEDKYRTNKDGTQSQFINSIGITRWSDDEENLPTWFASRDYRLARVGEEELYNFLRNWLGKLDLRDPESRIELDWKKLMKGDVRELKEQVGGSFSVPFLWLLEVKTLVVTDEEGNETVKEFQNVYNKNFLPEYYLKRFKVVNYNNSEVLAKLRAKDSKQLEPHERFVLQVTGEHGSKNFFSLTEICDYSPELNIVAKNVTKEDENDVSSY